jgi:hypothetical protein
MQHNVRRTRSHRSAETDRICVGRSHGPQARPTGRTAPSVMADNRAPNRMAPAVLELHPLEGWLVRQFPHADPHLRAGLLS